MVKKKVSTFFDKYKYAISVLASIALMETTLASFGIPRMLDIWRYVTSDPDQKRLIEALIKDAEIKTNILKSTMNKKMMYGCTMYEIPIHPDVRKKPKWVSKYVFVDEGNGFETQYRAIIAPEKEEVVYINGKGKVCECNILK